MRNKTVADWRAKHPEQWAAQRRRALMRKYGLEPGAYEAILEIQNGVCAICKRPSPNSRRLSVDHDHITGRVRGLLCDNCNPGIGYFKDSVALLDAAKAYLSR